MTNTFEANALAALALAMQDVSIEDKNDLPWLPSVASHSLHHKTFVEEPGGCRPQSHAGRPSAKPPEECPQPGLIIQKILLQTAPPV